MCDAAAVQTVGARRKPTPSRGPVNTQPEQQPSCRRPKLVLCYVDGECHHCTGSSALEGAAAAAGSPPGQPASEAAPLLDAADPGFATSPAAAAMQDSTAGSTAANDCHGTDDIKWTAWQIARRLQGYAAAVALTFLVTLAVFPGVASSICPSQSTAATPPCTPHPHAGRFYGELRVIPAPMARRTSSWRLMSHEQTLQVPTRASGDWLSADDVQQLPEAYSCIVVAGELFVPFVFVLFNLGDLLGRAMAGRGPWAAAPPPVSACGVAEVAS